MSVDPRREGYAPINTGESTSALSGPDTLGRSTRISIPPPNPASQRAGDWEEQTGNAFTFGFAAGKSAAEGLKKVLAEKAAAAVAAARGPNGKPKEQEKTEQLDKAKEMKSARASLSALRSTVGPGQMSMRQRDKFVPLPDAGGGLDEEEESEELQDLLQPEPAAGSELRNRLDWEPLLSDLASLDAELASAPADSPFAEVSRQQQQQPQRFLPRAQSMSAAVSTASRGRITVYCMAEGLDRKSLMQFAHSGNYKPHSVHTYIDVVHLRIDETQKNPVPDAFFFDYGVIICWGLEEKEEKELVGKVCKDCEVGPYLPQEVEIDEFQFNYSANEPPHIKNDMITINKRQASDHQVRLAISHALAQSVKLSLYEERVIELVEETKDLPEALAKFGKVAISSKKIAKLIGKVFLQNSTVNLLSTVLGTPEFFWSAPDSLQALYERACEYLELDTRVGVLNARFQVLQEMLDMLRDHQNNAHASRLEWIIIWLLVVDVVLMLFQLMGLFGLITSLPL